MQQPPADSDERYEYIQRLRKRYERGVFKPVGLHQPLPVGFLEDLFPGVFEPEQVYS